MENDRAHPPASAPCSLADADPAYAGLPPSREAVLAWRRDMRERLIAARRAQDHAKRRQDDVKIAERLTAAIGAVDGLTVSLYWPFRAEPDLRAWAAGVADEGARLALPVVIEPRQPMVFRAWAPGDPLEKGVWNIPIPARDDRVTPDVLIAPVVGYDEGGYRLGYGGGYFDRTLASLPGGWRAFAVGYPLAALPTIHPLPHDVPFDAIVTPEATIAGRAVRR